MAHSVRTVHDHVLKWVKQSGEIKGLPINQKHEVG